MKWLLLTTILIISPICLFVQAVAEVTNLQVKDIAQELACLCGTCPRRPLHECSCGWADKYRARIKEAIETGQEKSAIITSFVSEFGQEAFSAPPKSGFNLTAWVMPFLALALGGFAVRKVIISWSQNKHSVVLSSKIQTDEDKTYLTRLEQELKERNP